MARWLSETRAKARNPQKTKAWASAGKGALADDFGLEEDFADEGPDAVGDGRRDQPRSLRAAKMVRRMGPKRSKKSDGGGGGEEQQEEDFERGEVLGLGEGHTGMIPLGVVSGQ